MERCPQPVIAAIHGACVGGAVDLACACDVRLCSEDARFCIAEVKVGLAADVGTLQRMPKVRACVHIARIFVCDSILIRYITRIMRILSCDLVYHVI